jgi:hypothetical protein
MTTPEQIAAQQEMSRIACMERLAVGFANELGNVLEADARIDLLRTVPTISGFVTEHEEHRLIDGCEVTTRRLWLCEVKDGRITEAVAYRLAGHVIARPL